MFEICLLQPPLRRTDETPKDAVRNVISMMDSIISLREKEYNKNSGDDDNEKKENNSIDMFLLPELCPIGYSEDTFLNYLPSTPERRKILRMDIDEELKKAARRYNAAICYGTIGWEEIDDDEEEDHRINNSNKFQYYIRQNVIDGTGSIIASYDKIHLCDYGDCAETRYFTPGKNAISFRIGNNDWKFGLLVCADIRYPNLSRTLCSSKKDHHGVDVLLQPSCFSRDVSFRTWNSFRETRAVENGVYFVACNYAGNDYGESAIIPPGWLVHPFEQPITLGTDVGYIITTFDKQVLQKARTELPFHKSLNCNIEY